MLGCFFYDNFRFNCAIGKALPTIYKVATCNGIVMANLIKRTDQIAQLFNGILYMIDSHSGVKINVNNTALVKTQAIQRFSVTSLL